MQEDIEPPEELVADVLGAWQIHQIFDEGSGESIEEGMAGDFGGGDFSDELQGQES